MKQRFKWLKAAAPALAAILLAGCAAGGKTAAAARETAQADATAAPTAAPAPALHWIDDVNSRGYYRITYAPAGGVYGCRMDFDTAEMVRIGEDLDPPTGNVSVFADEDALYWSWSGMVTTTPYLLKSDLDGGNRQPMYDFEQGTSLNVRNQGLASDGENLYFSLCHISDKPTKADEYSLVQLNAADQTLETVTTWNELGGSLVGVWGNRLLLTRYALDESCPVEPVINYYRVDNKEALRPWLTLTLSALDPATGEETPLYSETGTLYFEKTLAEDALWYVDDQNRLLRCPLGTDTDEVVTTLPQAMGLMGVYDTDILFWGDNDGTRALYLYDRATGKLNASPWQTWHKSELSPLLVLRQARPGEYLVIVSQVPVHKTLIGTGGLPYTANTTQTNYALATRAALLDDTADLRVLATPDWFAE